VTERDAHDLEKPRLDWWQQWREGVSARKNKDGKKGKVAHMIGRRMKMRASLSLSSQDVVLRMMLVLLMLGV
jgi:hypothetical protein